MQFQLCLVKDGHYNEEGAGSPEWNQLKETFLFTHLFYGFVQNLAFV